MIFNSSTNSSWIRSKSLSKYRCQASALALNRVFQKIFSTVMADRRRSLTPRVLHPSPAFCRAGHAPWTSWRRSSALKPPRACPSALAAPFSFLRPLCSPSLCWNAKAAEPKKNPAPPRALVRLLPAKAPTCVPPHQRPHRRRFFSPGRAHRVGGSTGSP